jgi:hypothetical protein
MTDKRLSQLRRENPSGVFCVGRPQGYYLLDLGIPASLCVWLSSSWKRAPTLQVLVTMTRILLLYWHAKIVSAYNRALIQSINTSVFS